jgi:hypothetical protein
MFRRLFKKDVEQLPNPKMTKQELEELEFQCQADLVEFDICKESILEEEVKEFYDIQVFILEEEVKEFYDIQVLKLPERELKIPILFLNEKFFKLSKKFEWRNTDYESAFEYLEQVTETYLRNIDLFLTFKKITDVEKEYASKLVLNIDYKKISLYEYVKSIVDPSFCSRSVSNERDKQYLKAEDTYSKFVQSTTIDFFKRDERHYKRASTLLINKSYELKKIGTELEKNRRNLEEYDVQKL